VPWPAASWVLTTTITQIASAVGARGISEDFCVNVSLDGGSSLS
jgi:hypothetical protein